MRPALSRSHVASVRCSIRVPSGGVCVTVVTASPEYGALVTTGPVIGSLGSGAAVWAGAGPPVRPPRACARASVAVAAIAQATMQGRQIERRDVIDSAP